MMVFFFPQPRELQQGSSRLPVLYFHRICHEFEPLLSFGNIQRTTAAILRLFSAVRPPCRNLEAKCLHLLKDTSRFQQFKQILAFFFTNGLQSSSVVVTKLIDFCSSASQMSTAASIFDQVPHPSAFIWTAMIRGFARNGPQEISVLYFSEMRRVGVLPIHLTHPFVLKACSALMEGQQVHADIFKTGFVLDVYVQNCVLDFYAKCGLMQDARKVYDEVPQRDLVSHTSLISGYFGVGDLVSAQSVFDLVEEAADVVLWSAVITGYSQNGAPTEAMECFNRMRRSNVRPNAVTMVNVISACSQLADYEGGKCVHNFVIETGMKMDIVVFTSLLDMYIKGGFIEEACKVFEQMPKKDVVSWNSLINGYIQNGYAAEALHLFRDMLMLGIEPNRVTFLSALSSCAQLGALEKGKEIEHLVQKLGLSLDLSIRTALLDMYAKCGSLMDAHNIFYETQYRDVIIWSALMNCYATNGCFMEILSLFGGMLKEGIRPNEVTYVGILTSCSHKGLVQEGFQHFDSMITDHGIAPRAEHYACMVDLLGRAGRIQDAKVFIDSMPIEPTASVWGSLLGACVTHKNFEVAKYASEHLDKLEPASDQYFVFLSNIYASMHRWEDVQSVRTSMKSGGTRKTPGCSWIEIADKIHEFLVGDRAHPLHHQIYEILDSLTEQLRLASEFSTKTDVLL